MKIAVFILCVAVLTAIVESSRSRDPLERLFFDHASVKPVASIEIISTGNLDDFLGGGSKKGPGIDLDRVMEDFFQDFAKMIVPIEREIEMMGKKHPHAIMGSVKESEHVDDGIEVISVETKKKADKKRIKGKERPIHVVHKSFFGTLLKFSCFAVLFFIMLFVLKLVVGKYVDSKQGRGFSINSSSKFEKVEY